MIIYGHSEVCQSSAPCIMYKRMKAEIIMGFHFWQFRIYHEVVDCNFKSCKSLFSILTDHVEIRGASAKGQLSKGIRCNYNTNFKLIVIHHKENTNNCDASRKFDVYEANAHRWKSAKHEIRKTKSIRKSQWFKSRPIPKCRSGKVCAYSAAKLHACFDGRYDSETP